MDKLREDSQVDEGGPRWTKVDAAAFLSSALQDENAMLSCMMEETDLGNWLKDPFATRQEQKTYPHDPRDQLKLTTAVGHRPKAQRHTPIGNA